MGQSGDDDDDDDDSRRARPGLACGLLFLLSS